MAIIDAHQHFWKLDNPGHQWPDADWPRIHRDFLPADLRGATAGIDLVGSVLVQSQPHDGDTDWLIAIADQDPLVLAVVGWVDLAGRGAVDRIATLAGHDKLRGLRPMLQAMADQTWMLRPELAPAIEAMIAHGLRFDALVQPRHLPSLATFAKRWPELPIVIDHGAKPDIAGGEPGAWQDDIAALAALPNVHCKLSGLRTEQPCGQPPGELAPYVTHLVSQFGGRLMWGSDWPVLLHAGDDYADWLRDAEQLAQPEDEATRATLFAGTAARFYNIGPQPNRLTTPDNVNDNANIQGEDL